MWIFKLTTLAAIFLGAAAAHSTNHVAGEYAEYGNWAVETWAASHTAHAFAGNAVLQVVCFVSGSGSPNSVQLGLGPATRTATFGWQFD